MGNTSVNKIRVFLADDHTVLREATAELVDHQPDMEVVGQAGTGEEAIALVRELHPEVVVMDAAMPRMNGIEATRLIVSECPETRVVVLSANEGEQIISCAGTYKGLDTALVVCATYSMNFFRDFEIREIITRPRNRVKELPEYG